MANPEEQKDIDALKEKQVELKLRCVDYLLFISKESNDSLIRMGYRNGLGDALRLQIEHLRKNIEIEQKKFLKKWPD